MLICRNCGTAHQGQRVLPGSGWIELVLWLAYIIPGLIYSIWRRSTRRPTCAACGSRDLVSTATPIGRKLAQEHYPDGNLPPPLPAGPAPAARRTSPVLVFALALVLLGAALVIFKPGV